MLYISGKNETLNDLKTSEGFEGSINEYEQKFNQLNHQLDLKTTNLNQSLPSYTPVFPVLQSVLMDPHRISIAQEIAKFTTSERETLRGMQEHDIELPAILATKKIVTEYASHLSSIRKHLEDPLIKSPWKFWNDNFTLDLLPDLISESLFYKAHSIQRSFLFNGLTQLEKDMVTMDALQMQLYSIRNQKNAKAFMIKQNLQKQIAQLASQIKKQVFPKIQDELSSHLNGCYTADQLKKLSRTSYGERMARKGKMKTTYLDLSSKTGLHGMREAIPLFKNIGTFAGKTATCINWASLGYDCLDAALSYDLERSIRIAMSGTAGMYAGYHVTAYLIGFAGTTFLVSTPIGWAVVIIGALGAGKLVCDNVITFSDCMLSGTVSRLKENSTVKSIIEFFLSSIEQISESFIDEKQYVIY
jgi:hypothetical protein